MDSAILNRKRSLPPPTCNIRFGQFNVIRKATIDQEPVGDETSAVYSSDWHEFATTHRERYNRRHKKDPEEDHSIAELARMSNVPERILREVYKRGIGAHHTNPQSVRTKGTYRKDAKAPMSKKLSPEQWAMARVYAFLDKLEDSNQTLNHDNDLADEIKGKKHKTDKDKD